MSAEEITQLLQRWSAGDKGALDDLTPLVYDRLHRLAQSAYKNEHGAQTLQATAVVNEAWMQMAGARLELQDRHHFYALAARMMRRILVNHAVGRKAAKRGGGELLLTLNEAQVAGGRESEQVLELHEALETLSDQDGQLAQILELHYFGGYTAAEVAHAMGVSESTAKRQLRFARAWVRREMDSHGL